MIATMDRTEAPAGAGSVTIDGLDAYFQVGDEPVDMAFSITMHGRTEHFKSLRTAHGWTVTRLDEDGDVVEDNPEISMMPWSDIGNMLLGCIELCRRLAERRASTTGGRGER